MGRGRWTVGVRPPRGREGRYWQLRVRERGSRREAIRSSRKHDPEGKGATCREAALRIAAAYEERLNREGCEPLDVSALYLAYCRGRVAAGTLRASTLLRRRQALDAIGDLLDAPPTRERVLACQDSLLTRCAVSTTRETLRTARSVWKWAHDRGMVATPWPQVPLPPEVPTSLVPPALAQVEALMVAAYERERHYYPALALIYETGARGCEAVALRGRDVDRDASPPVVRFRRRHKTAASLRVVTISAELAAALPSAEPDQPVFRGQVRGRNKPLNLTLLRRAWGRCVRACGLDTERFGGLHSLRRLWAATHGGEDEDAAMRCLGQTNVRTFRRYARHGLDSRAAAAAERVRGILPALPHAARSHSHSHATE